MLPRRFFLYDKHEKENVVQCQRITISDIIEIIVGAVETLCLAGDKYLATDIIQIPL